MNNSKNNWWGRIKEPFVPKESGPRSFNEGDYNDFFDTANAKPPRNQTRQELAAMIRAKNPVRWRYLQRDFKWAQKQAEKLGINPEDVRWLL